MKAIGVDIGTAFIGSMWHEKTGTRAKYVRDGFFKMPWAQQRVYMLEKSHVNFLVKDRPNVPGQRDIFVVGNEAFDMAVLFGQELKRPLKDGIISAQERETEFILKEIIKQVVGVGEPGDVGVYSVPADPVDRDFNIIYHREMFKRFIAEAGYKSSHLNEGMAVVYSELESTDFTGLGISCLTPGQKIFTGRGFINIEDVKPGDSVLTKEGVWVSAIPTSRKYEGRVYEISAYGAGKVEITEDHKVWVYRDEVWQWVSAKSLVVGDLVKQPWVNYNLSKKDKTIFCEKRITSSKKRQTVCLPVSSEVLELIGYFLGDGHVQTSRYTIAFTFNKGEEAIAERVLYLVKSIFDCEGRYIEHTENDIRVGFDCAWFCNWLDRHCYSFGRDKIVPWPIDTFSDNDLRYILKGLIESDGSYTGDSLSFYNTSASLSQFVYLGLLRLGLCPTFFCREARLGGMVEGRQIVGVKDEFSVSSRGWDASCYIQWIKNPTRTAKKVATHGAMVSKITAITERVYCGLVHDVSVEGKDHSFCVPGIALHNCGAGMINVALSYKGMEVFSFSVARAGDWIDQNVSNSRAIPTSDACAVKERVDDEKKSSKAFDLLKPQDDVEEAIKIFYEAMLEYVFGYIVANVEKHQRKIKLSEPLPFVVAGGTTMPKGFLTLLENTLKMHPLPIPVGKVWQAKNPVMAVCRGCLRMAQSQLADEKYDGVTDISGGENTKHQYPTKPKEAPPEPKVRTPKDKADAADKARVVENNAGMTDAVNLGG